jgi:hypothetical protein
MLLHEATELKQATSDRKIIKLEKQLAIHNECIAELWEVLQHLLQ